MLFSSFSDDARSPSNAPDMRSKNGRVRAVSYNDLIKEEKRMNKKARERLTARVEQHRAEAAKKSEKSRNL